MATAQAIQVPLPVETQEVLLTAIHMDIVEIQELVISI